MSRFTKAFFVLLFPYALATGVGFAQTSQAPADVHYGTPLKPIPNPLAQQNSVLPPARQGQPQTDSSIYVYRRSGQPSQVEVPPVTRGTQSGVQYEVYQPQLQQPQNQAQQGQGRQRPRLQFPSRDQTAARPRPGPIPGTSGTQAEQGQYDPLGPATHDPVRVPVPLPDTQITIAPQGPFPQPPAGPNAPITLPSPQTGVPGQGSGIPIPQPQVTVATGTPLPAPPDLAPYSISADPNGPKAIAILVPLSDKRQQVRELAEALMNAAQMAAEDINDPLMILRAYDTKGDANEAGRVAQQAIAEGAELLIGPLFASSAKSVREVVAPYNINALAFTTDASALGGNIYSIAFLPDSEIDRMLGYAAEQGLQRIGLFLPDTAYGRVAHQAALTAAIQYGLDLTYVQTFKTDFESIDQAAKAFADVYLAGKEAEIPLEAVLLPTNGKTLQAAASFLAYYDVLPAEVKYMGVSSWQSDDIFGESALQKGWFPAASQSLKLRFDERYAERFEKTPHALVRLAYDAVAASAALMAEARAAGDPAAFSMQRLVDPAGFAGVTGVFRFTSDGRNQRGLSVLEIDGRKFATIAPAPRDFSRFGSSY